MHFHRLYVAAFNRFRAPFTVPLDTPGLILVEGENRDWQDAANSNGSGKSLACVETLLWCLFGKMARHGDKNIATQAKHLKHGADVTVTLSRRGTALHVRRQAPAKGRPSFSVTTDDGAAVPFSRDPARRAEDAAELFGLDYAAVRAAIVIGGGTSLCAAGFAAQMQVLETVLRLDELSTAADLAAKEALALEKQVGAMQAEHAVRQHTLTADETALAQLRATLATDLTPVLTRLEAELAHAEHAARWVPDLRSVVEDTANARDRAKADEVAATAELATLARRQQEARAQQSSTTCTACGRPYADAAERERANAAAAATLTTLDTQVTAVLAKREAARMRLTALTTKLDAQREELRTHEAHAGQQARIAEQIAQVTAQQRERDAQVADAEARVDDTRQTLAKTATALAGLQAAHRRAAFWAQGYGRDGLQADVFSTGMPVLQQAADHYGQRLTHGQLAVTYNPLRGSTADTLIRLTRADGTAATYAELSAGEKDRVDIVNGFALRALARWRLAALDPVATAVNLAVFDETFDAIDDAGLKVVVRLLDEEVATGATVFVITHSSTLKALFPTARVLRVVRERDEATVTFT